MKGCIKLSSEFLRRAFGGTQGIPIKPMLRGNPGFTVVSDYCYVDEDNPATNYFGLSALQLAQPGNTAVPAGNGERKTIWRFPAPVGGTRFMFGYNTSSGGLSASGVMSAGSPLDVQEDQSFIVYAKGISSFNGLDTSTINWNNYTTLTLDGATEKAAFQLSFEGRKSPSGTGYLSGFTLVPSGVIEGILFYIDDYNISGFSTDYYVASGSIPASIYMAVQT